MSSSAARERIAVAGVERRAHAPAAGEAVDDVVRDPVAFLLADLQVLGERRVLGVVDEQVAQQQAAALDVAPGLLDERHQLGVDGARAGSSSARILIERAATCAFHGFFTDRSRLCNALARRALATLRVVAVYPESADVPDVLHAGELEIRPDEGLVLATGQRADAVGARVRAARAMARRQGAIITREDLYARGLGRRAAPRRPLGRRLRAASSATSSRPPCRTAASSTPTRASATASNRSLHEMFTRGHSQLRDCCRAVKAVCPGRPRKAVRGLASWSQRRTPAARGDRNRYAARRGDTKIHSRRR